jgi:hypothetical protein
MLTEVDALLRGTGRFRTGSGRVPWVMLGLLLCAGGLTYGGCMGSFAGRPLQILYSALKVPLLVCVTTAICLPSFFVINSLLGLRADFADACRGVFSAQATMAVTLLAQAPLVLFAYLSTDDYRFAVLVNGVYFAIATAAAQVTLNRHYSVLMRRNPSHGIARTAWVVLYVFVAIQCAWVMRPYIGDPSLEVRFFRAEAWSNAYVRVAETLWSFLTSRG